MKSFHDTPNWLVYITGKIRDHGYHLIFEKFLDRKSKTVVELGCKAGSAKMWNDYFPEAKIYGCDRYSVQYVDDSFTCIKMDMHNASDYDKLPDNIDVIIEDGPHTSKSQLIMLDACLDKMAKNGVIIIEDLHCTDPLYEESYIKYKGKSDITTNELLREWNLGIFNDYKYIKGSRFANKDLEITITRGEWSNDPNREEPSEVIVLKVK